VSSSSIRSPEGGTEMAQKVRPNYAFERSVTALSKRATADHGHWTALGEEVGNASR
jgi:hypothetical protein